VEIISHCVWLYHWFPLSLRDVEQMMALRGVSVSYDTIHQWCRKVGQTSATGLRRRQACPGDQWHLDEVFITIRGKTHNTVAGGGPARDRAGHSGHLPA